MSEESRRQARRERLEAERRAAAGQAASQPVTGTAQSVETSAVKPTIIPAANAGTTVGTSPVAAQAGGTVENIRSQPAENAGGPGGARERPPEARPEILPASIDLTSIKDQRLVARALSEFWEIDPQYRGPLIKGQIAIALDTKKDDRDRTRAFLAVTKASQQNLAVVKTVAEIEKPTTSTQVNVGVAVNNGIDLTALHQKLLDRPDVLASLRRAEMEPLPAIVHDSQPVAP